MNAYVAEFIGTTVLVLLGNGVVANVLLTQTKGHGAGWIAITAGWGMAVFVAVSCTQDASGAHLNPAVTLGLALAQQFPWAQLPGYVAAQMAGGVLGGALVFVFYQLHYATTDDAGLKLGTFCTAPAFRVAPVNLFCEIVATWVLVFTVLLFSPPSITLAGPAQASGTVGLGAVGALPVGLLVFAIGVSLGGTTGYAINPARDLGPRIAHFLLPIPGKGGSDWGYAWIPVLGPLGGGALAALIYHLST